MNQKSQIQIGETIAVLFVFFILIVIGFMFYGKVILGSIQAQKDESTQLRSVSIAQKAMFLPEIQCSEDIVEEITGCIDILKISAAQDVIGKNSRYYYDLFEFSNITMRQIYPTDNYWIIYSRSTSNFTKNFENKFVTNVPISLYNPITRRYGFGVLTVETLLK